MSWIDDMNKKLQEQREDFKKSKKDGTTLSRARSYSRSCRKHEPSKSHFQKMSKKGLKTLRESGLIDKFQKAGTIAATKAQKERQIQNQIKFAKMLPKKGITYKMAQDASESLGYRRVQAVRLLQATCEFENKVVSKGGKIMWSKSTFRKLAH